ncbi:hypothetical protein E1180_11375 [Roseibium denhamense]|uniref:ABC-type uncharacterized transport system, substrate-binding protein n=1 Tax=Roseibium denhamense TaxID=76305 RepID=A0ABY1N5W7_9HYPH|nr:ABC transporter substrate binding protein [Roseibium denhamense]MTI06113.1 hypothetical protein [Roseibium denhamense]SMP01101.1 ABC-type uncharacterized transport system, substrate-binding protein [Roseibium denhamense]
MLIRALALKLLIALSLCQIHASALADDTKQILLITWRGMTAAEQGFMYALTDMGVKANFAQFDASRSETKLAGYLREHRKDLEQLDLIYTFGTTATKVVQNFGIADVPQIFNVVADPVGSGITLSYGKPTKGVTGAKMSLSTKVVLQLMERLLDFETIAVVLDPRETASVVEADTLTLAAEAMNKTAKRLRFIPDAGNVDHQIAALKPDLESVDVIFVTASAAFVDHAETMRKLLPQTVVSVATSPALLDAGATVAFGAEYAQRGEAAAQIAAQILLDGKSPDMVPIDEVQVNEAALFIRMHSPANTLLNLGKAANPIIFK